MTEDDRDSGRVFADVGRLYAAGNIAIAIVTAAHDGRESGCVVGFHGQISIAPPRWGLWMSEVNHTYPIVTNAAMVAVHFPSKDQFELANHFGHLTGDEVDKFAGVAVTRDDYGTPILADVAHHLVGRRSDTYFADGDSACVIVDPVAVRFDGELDPLRFDRCASIIPGHPAY